uniref:Uncharacterized protein n=1 Tax=Pygocentrus nattereri TaxID=42514 RepID=A0AAR2KAF4_PYGNA
KSWTGHFLLPVKVPALPRRCSVSQLAVILMVVLVENEQELVLRPSYGRLLDDTEYGSVGNVLNPMFEG